MIPILNIAILMIPAAYRTYTIRNSEESVSISEIIGCWKQMAENNNSETANTKSSEVCFKENSNYIVTTQNSNGLPEEFSGVFYFSNEHIKLFGFIDCGYRNWLRLNMEHDAGPQFYIKKKNGLLQLYRGNYRASISRETFTKVSQGSL